MKAKANSPEAYKLLQEGILALADAEEFGITVDVDYCVRMQEEIAGDKLDLEEALWYTELGKGWKKWAKRNHTTPQLGGDQLASVLDYMGIVGEKKTKTGKVSTDEEALKDLEVDGVETLIQIRKMEKISGTYLSQLLNEAEDGVVHPMFNLNIPKTYRSSCSNPSIQNFPIRDPWQGKVIRSAIIPRGKGRRLVEADFSGLEVRVAACYNKDPMLIKYLADSSLDMHRDMACECFLLEPEEVQKWTRHAAKNMFVFPQFYGSYYEQCAINLWKRTPAIHMEGDEDISIRDHLKAEGIKSLKAFTAHIKSVEDSFWNDRFKVYTAWKKNHYNSYIKNGFVDSFTGFRYSGEMKRTEVINYPIQGAAFHCNLWSLIQMNKWIKEHKMETRIIGQIHDSIILDVVESEFEDVYEALQRITCDELPETWKWINVRMEIEVEAAPVGASWYEKKEIVM